MAYVILNQLLVLSRAVAMPVKGSPTPWSYVLIRYVPVLAFIVFLNSPIFSLLFQFVLKIFYGTIVIENVDLIPEAGRPWSVVIHP